MVEMTSEVQNILNGRVNATHDFQQKKVIGVSTNNLIPGPNGIEPLAKQGAFKQPETIDFAQAITDANQSEADPIEETLDLPVIDEDNNKGLKIPVIPEIISEENVKTASPSFLDSFQMPQIPGQSTEPVIEEKDDYRPVIDIQMPVMPDTVLGGEPTGPQEELFEKPDEKEMQPEFNIPILENNSNNDNNDTAQDNNKENQNDFLGQIPSAYSSSEPTVEGEPIKEDTREENDALPIAMTLPVAETQEEKNKESQEMANEEKESNGDTLENIRKELDSYIRNNEKIINGLFEALICAHEELKKANERQLQLSRELQKVAGNQQNNFPSYLGEMNSQESNLTLQR